VPRTAAAAGTGRLPAAPTCRPVVGTRGWRLPSRCRRSRRCGRLRG
jgi:hypothetical protein